MPTRSISPPTRNHASVFRVVARGQRKRPFEDIYHFLLIRPWSVFLVIAGSFYIAACFLFALLYLAQDGAITNARAGSLEDAFFFSVQTMSTIGYGSLAPATRWANVLVSLQAVVNILLVALFTGITFAKFSRPTARVLFTERAIVGMQNGVPHLMVRLANWRHNQVSDAQVRLYVVMEEVTTEGDSIRRPVELTLVRSSTPIFFLTFTVMHRIDSDSPLANPETLAALMEENTDLIVGFAGMDTTLGQQIQARYSYSIRDVVWGAQFANVLRVEPGGLREIDYTKFHEILPRELPPGVAPLPRKGQVTPRA